MRTASNSIQRGGAILYVLAIALHLLAAPAAAQLQLPPIPPDAYFTQDHANILPPDAEQRIGEMQREAFEQHDTPIVVVTIGSMAEYGGQGYSIERFAHDWFNHWQIGKRGESGELINRGILLLISVGDRKARIELGADWGNRWDGYAAEVMDEAIVPEFKVGDYGGGAVAGVAGLSEMVAMGPDAAPPQGLGNLLESLNDKPLPTTPLPTWGIGLMFITGVGLIVLAIFMPEQRKWLLIAGIGLIAGAFVLWVLVAVFAIFSKGRRGSSGSFGGGFSSSGGFGGGGFSGGGGASGSW